MEKYIKAKTEEYEARIKVINKNTFTDSWNIGYDMAEKQALEKFITVLEELHAKSNQQVESAVKLALQMASEEGWLTYHCGTTKSNTHGHKQINIGADHIKIDKHSITSLQQQVLREINK